MKVCITSMVQAVGFVLATAAVSMAGTQYCESTYGGSNNIPNNVIAGSEVCSPNSKMKGGATRQFIFQTYEQFDFSSGAPCTFIWIDGTTEAGIQGAETVGFGITIFSNGELIFGQDDSGNIECVDPVNLHVSVPINGTIIGGTGSLSGATGTYHSQSFSAYFVPGVFGWVFGTGTSSVVLP